MTVHEFSGDWGSARVAELGGCVLSWAPLGRERLLVPDAGDLVEGSMWHGGIPVCAPWFGVGDGSWSPTHTHGLVARVNWRLVEAASEATGARVALTTSGAEHAHIPGAERYPADLSYRLDVAFSGSSLTICLTISSPTTAVTVDHALHPYWLAAAAESRVDGLDGLAYRDAANAWRPGQQLGPLGLAGPLDLVFDEAPATTLTTPAGPLLLSATGARSLVAWRPEAFPAREFVCVEYGSVRHRAVSIPAGEQHRLCLHARVGCRPPTGSEAP